MRQKLINYVKNTTIFNEEISQEIEKFKTETEQTHFELEKNIDLINDKLKDANEKIHKKDQEILELEQIKHKYQTVIDIKTSEIIKQNFEKEEIKNNICLLELDNKNIQNLLSEKEKIIVNIESDIKVMSEKIIILSASRNELQSNYNNEINKSLTLNHKFENCKFRHENLEQHIKILEDEIKLKDKEHLNGIRDKMNQLTNLKVKMEEIDNSFQGVSNQNQMLKDKLSEYETMTKDLIEKNYKLECDLECKVKEITEKFVIAEDRCRMLTNVNSDYETRYKQLKVSLEDIKVVLTQTQKGNQLIDGELKNMGKLHNETLKEKDDEITIMKKKLEESKSQLESIKKKSALPRRHFSITEADTSDGENILGTQMNFTQLYNYYVNNLKEIDDLKIENRKLNLSMECIMQEIDRKAPILIKQGQEYKRLIKTVDMLSQELDEAKTLLRNTQIEKQSLTLDLKRVNYQWENVKRKVKRLASNQDITEFVDSEDDNNVSSSALDRSSKRMRVHKTHDFYESETSMNPTAFKQILDILEEDYTDSMTNNKANSDVDAEDLLNLSKKIDYFEQEIIRCKEINREQSTLIQTLRKQTNQYQKLMSESGIMADKNIKTSDSLDTKEQAYTAIEQEAKIDTESKILLGRMNTELENFKKIYLERETDLVKKLHDANLSNTDLKLANNKLNYQLQLNEGKDKNLKFRIDELGQELEIVRKNGTLMTSKLTEKEIKIDELYTEVISHKQNIVSLESSIKRLQGEKANLEMEIESIAKRKTDIVKEDSRYDAILNNIRNLKNTFEVTEKETVCKLASQNVILQQERMELKIRLESLILETSGKMDDLEKRLEESQKSLKNITQHDQNLESEKWALKNENLNIKRVANRKLKKLMTSALSHSKALSVSIDNLADAYLFKEDVEGKQLNSTIIEGGSDIEADDRIDEIFSTVFANRSMTEPDSKSPLGTRSLSNLTRIKDEEIRDLKNVIQNSDQHIVQYQSITTALETQLNQSQDLVENLERIIEKQFEQMRLIKEEMSAEITNLKTRLTQTQSDLMNSQKSLANQTMLNTQDLDSINERLILEIDKNTELEEKCLAKTELTEHLRKELEGSKHKIDALIECVEDLGKRMEGSRANILEENLEVGKAENDLMDLDTSGAETKGKLDQYSKKNTKLEQENKELLSKCNSLEKFCDSLNQEIEKLKSQWADVMGRSDDSTNDITLVEIQEIFGRNQDGDNSTANNNPERGLNLIKYINYLKRFNKSSRNDNETMKMEIARYTLKIDSLQTEISNLSDLLNEERKNNQSYLYLEKMSSFQSEKEDRDMEIRILKDNNEKLHRKYLEIIEETSKPVKPDQEAIKLAQSMKIENKTLHTENTNLKNSLSRLDEKCAKQNLEIINLGSKSDEIKRLKNDVEETSLKLAVYLNKDQLNEDKIRDYAIESEAQRTKIEEMRVTNNKLKGIARKYKQLHESSQVANPDNNNNMLEPTSSMADNTGFGVSSEIGLIGDGVNTSHDESFKRRYDEALIETDNYRTKCEGLHKELEEKNLRLASLKSQYEARFNRLKLQLQNQQVSAIAFESPIDKKEPEIKNATEMFTDNYPNSKTNEEDMTGSKTLFITVASTSTPTKISHTTKWEPDLETQDNTIPTHIITVPEDTKISNISPSHSFYASSQTDSHGLSAPPPKANIKPFGSFYRTTPSSSQRILPSTTFVLTNTTINSAFTNNYSYSTALSCTPQTTSLFFSSLANPCINVFSDLRASTAIASFQLDHNNYISDFSYGSTTAFDASRCISTLESNILDNSLTDIVPTVSESSSTSDWTSPSISLVIEPYSSLSPLVTPVFSDSTITNVNFGGSSNTNLNEATFGDNQSTPIFSNVVSPINIGGHGIFSGGKTSYADVSFSGSNSASYYSSSTLPYSHQKPAVCIKPLSFAQYSPLTKVNITTIGIASPNVQQVFSSSSSEPSPQTAITNSAGLVVVNPYNFYNTVTTSSTIIDTSSGDNDASYTSTSWFYTTIERSSTTNIFTTTFPDSEPSNRYDGENNNALTTSANNFFTSPNLPPFGSSHFAKNEITPFLIRDPDSSTNNLNVFSSTHHPSITSQQEEYTEEPGPSSSQHKFSARNDGKDFKLNASILPSTVFSKNDGAYFSLLTPFNQSPLQKVVHQSIIQQSPLFNTTNVFPGSPLTPIHDSSSFGTLQHAKLDSRTSFFNEPTLRISSSTHSFESPHKVRTPKNIFPINDATGFISPMLNVGSAIKTPDVEEANQDTEIVSRPYSYPLFQIVSESILSSNTNTPDPPFPLIDYQQTQIVNASISEIEDNNDITTVTTAIGKVEPSLQQSIFTDHIQNPISAGIDSVERQPNSKNIVRLRPSGRNITNTPLSDSLSLSSQSQSNRRMLSPIVIGNHNTQRNSNIRSGHAINRRGNITINRRVRFQMRRGGAPK
ncbi:nucleoprotein TPR-like isoform X1 [Gordionus sp. m RMFG-2023]|uniref:nucleoprotein TPR-like isoform X1 n=1 Tax=Gordionus sp. m RMFG-2023 TaxID=3053472 RepID=UPI0031FC770B